MRTSRIGTGAVGVVALRAIAAGKSVYQALKPHIAGKAANAMLERMVEEGLIVRIQPRGYTITPRGLEELGLAAPVKPFRPYVPPPAPPRRANSDHSHIPSRVGDRLIPHWAHP